LVEPTLAATPVNIHALTVDAALDSLATGADGLTASEAARRLTQFGANRLEPARRRPLAVRFLREFTHFFAVILWVAALLAMVADVADPGHGMVTLGLAIIAVIVLNGVFSFWQQYRAEQAFLALQRLLPDSVTLARDGSVVRMSADALVPGDVVLLEAGDNISADCRVLQAFALRVNNATMTGESYPLTRDAQPDEETNPLRSRNALLAGTYVVSGSARALVVATGMGTEFGKIARLAQVTKEAPSPLQRELSTLSRFIALLAIGIGVVVFIVSGTLRLSWSSSFVFAIGIIVANVPEGLLPTLTLALAVASRRMAKRNVLVKRLTSVETLGATTVICTDKTGTLTQNQMAVQSLYVFDEWLSAATAGDRRARVMCVLETARRCHDVKATHGAHSESIGDPMEVALVGFAMPYVADAEKIDEIPFDSDRKRLVTVHRTDGGLVLHAKGALETVLPMCRWVSDGSGPQPLTAAHVDAFTAAQTEMAGKGLRVLAFAHRCISEPYDPAQLEQDLVLDGLIGLEDPPRPEVPRAIESCHRAGIRVIMITGDLPQTALAIGRQIGLFTTARPHVIPGDQVQLMSKAQLWAALERTDVLFARVAADQKLRIVTALQQRKAVVAVTGDGVNDAPALRAADIGVAMGLVGTDVARQAADIVLLDDNFASIVAAIEEGRGVYDNLRKFLTYILTSNVPELVPYLGFAFFNVPLALTVLQILAVDLGTDMVPALGLGAEEPEAGVMNRPPRTASEHVLTPGLLVRAYGFLGGLESLAAMTAFFAILPTFGYAAATTACLSAIVVMQVANVQVCRSSRESVFRSIRRPNGIIAAGVGVELAIILLIDYTPTGNVIFGTAPIPTCAWMLMLPFAAAMVVADEARKWALRATTQAPAGSRACAGLERSP
jgi:sodium/potassium-transporting ATPase subunit alpha